MSAGLCSIIVPYPRTDNSQPIGSTTQRIIGTTLTWTCNTGYVLQDGAKTTITCQADQTWSGGRPTCVADAGGLATQNSDLSEVIAAGTVAAIILLGLVIVCCCAAYWWANEEYVEIIHYTPTETTVPRKKLWLGNPGQSMGSDIQTTRIARPETQYIDEIILEPVEDQRRDSYSSYTIEEGRGGGGEIIEVIEERVEPHHHHAVITEAVEQPRTVWWKPNTWRWNAIPRLYRHQ